MNNMFNHPLFNGIQLKESPFPLEKDVPIKLHKHKHNQTKSYHLRIQKKWNKRFGMKKERYALMMNPKAAGMDFLGGPFAIVDRRDMAMLRGIL